MEKHGGVTNLIISVSMPTTFGRIPFINVGLILFITLLTPILTTALKKMDDSYCVILKKSCYRKCLLSYLSNLNLPPNPILH